MKKIIADKILKEIRKLIKFSMTSEVIIVNGETEKERIRSREETSAAGAISIEIEKNVQGRTPPSIKSEILGIFNFNILEKIKQ